MHFMFFSFLLLFTKIKKNNNLSLIEQSCLTTMSIRSLNSINIGYIFNNILNHKSKKLLQTYKFYFSNLWYLS